MKSFTLSNIVYDGQGGLTFKFTENSEKVVLGVNTIEEISEEIVKVISKIAKEDEQ